MSVPDYVYQVVKLSDKFYKDYPEKEYPELVTKESRRYNCLLLQTHYDYYICIPFRSNVKHNNAFFFRESKRSKKSASALDFSKIVIINNPDYIATTPGIVDKDEYNEMIRHMDYIVEKVVKYVEDYIKYFAYERTDVVDKMYYRLYRYSTLVYFNSIIINN